MTLTEFLLARIAEDEAIARTATNFPWRYRSGMGVQAWREDGLVSKTTPYRVAAQVQSWDGPHIARHDPARALAECDAKRAIVEDVVRMAEARHDLVAPSGIIARHIAAVYADHPDYDEAWRA